MLVRSLRVENYKSFADSGTVALDEGFNILVGQNNSGKTGFLDGLRMHQNLAKPHRSQIREKGSPPNPISFFELTIHATPKELRDKFLGHGNPVWIPIDQALQPSDVVHRLFDIDGMTTTLKFRTHGTEEPAYPSHGLFQHNPAMGKTAFRIVAREDRQNYIIEQASNNGQDDIHGLVAAVAFGKTFVFSAERMNLATCPFASPDRLQPNAANLARALYKMQGDPYLWKNFNASVNRVLPSIRSVVTEGSTSDGNAIEILTWPVDPATGRDDLKVRLADSGTGVSQVLAILCAAMTHERALIAIDEPGNFLHPGAIKALINILKEFGHQYVVTTHSLDVIAASEPRRTYQVRWEDCVSTIEAANMHDVESHKRMLAELGASLSDVFGMDRILWVEGETEERCLPIVAQAALGYMPSTTAVVRVHSVAELRDRSKRDERVWDLYQRLSTAGGLVPANASFLFDRDECSEQKIADLQRKSKDAIQFLPRRTYENYLLDPGLWLGELSSVAETHDVQHEVTSGWIDQWVLENARPFLPKDAPNCVPFDADFKRHVNGPALLKQLFHDAINVEYRKTEHSLSLTRRLLDSRNADCEELKTLVAKLVRPSPSPSKQSAD